MRSLANPVLLFEDAVHSSRTSSYPSGMTSPTAFAEQAHVPVLGHFFAGSAVPGASGMYSEVFDPARGEVSAQLALASPREVDSAVAAAKKACNAWAAVPVVQRARVMFRFKDLLERHCDELAALITSEHGKTLGDARGELMRGIEVVEFACGMPHLLKGEFSANVGTTVDSWSVRHPVGVCVGITPFNFPAMVPLWMFPIAITCGNTFILKPSEKVPSCALRLAELLIAAGLPDGVFNIINGNREAVDALLAHPDVAAASFVGSTKVAKHVFERGTSHGKRVQALGGAKNHLVVMPDADPRSAAQALLGAAYGSAGERCMAISVAVAVGSAADTLVKELKQMIAGLRVGPGTGEVDMGPLISREHRERVRSYIDAGVSEGAELIVDGRDCAQSAEGFFVGPTLFDRVQGHMRIYREEIFGPVLCVVRVENLNAALELIAVHEYGNGASIYTRSGEAARVFCERAQVGMVGVNVPIPVPMAFHSFGGWKRSLFGDLHMHGLDGVRFFTRLKTITARWSFEKNQAEFVMPTMRQ